jgi:hypothetical protein
MFNNFFYEIRAVYDIRWKNIVELDMPQKTIWHMRVSHWVPQAINTPSEYVILTAVPRQQWLHERASMLRYTYIGCPVNFLFCCQHFPL